MKNCPNCDEALDEAMIASSSCEHCGMPFEKWELSDDEEKEDGEEDEDKDEASLDDEEDEEEDKEEKG
jgi:hypothetical protein